MSSKKTLALALCVAITGCAQNPKNDADGGSWWPFGSSDKVASKDPAPAPAPTQLAPVLNEATKATASEGASSNIARKGRSSLVIPLTNTRQTGVNIPR